MIQFIYAVVGGGLCYVILNSLPKPSNYIVVTPFALFVAAMVFLKVNERPFLNFLVSVFQFFSTPKQRYWKHDNSSDLKIDVYKPQEKKKETVQTKFYSHKDFEEIAASLDKNKFTGK